MSIHPSLRGVDTLKGERNVFTRVERIQRLIKEGKMTEEDPPIGLPKVRTTFKIKTARAAKTAATKEEESPAEKPEEAAGQ